MNALNFDSDWDYFDALEAEQTEENMDPIEQMDMLDEVMNLGDEQWGS